MVIQNKNIGHSLIPEVRDLYEAWVEFAVKDASGKEIYHSGFLKPDGALDPRAHSFTNRPVNDEASPIADANRYMAQATGSRLPARARRFILEFVHSQTGPLPRCRRQYRRGRSRASLPSRNWRAQTFTRGVLTDIGSFGAAYRACGISQARCWSVPPMASAPS